MSAAETSPVKGRAARIAFVFHIPVGFQIPVHDVSCNNGLLELLPAQQFLYLLLKAVEYHISWDPSTVLLRPGEFDGQLSVVKPSSKTAATATRRALHSITRPFAVPPVTYNCTLFSRRASAYWLSPAARAHGCLVLL